MMGRKLELTDKEYAKWYTAKTPEPHPADLFHESYEMVPECGCWIWSKAPMCDGYGKARTCPGSMKAHRLSWILHFGAIPKGLQVLHKCDVRLCVNPRHLFLGTLKTNMNDMVQKSRQCRGINKPLAKLSEKDVLEMRAVSTFFSQRELARMYGLSPSVVSRIVNRLNWRHI